MYSLEDRIVGGSWHIKLKFTFLNGWVFFSPKNIQKNLRRINYRSRQGNYGGNTETQFSGALEKIVSVKTMRQRRLYGITILTGDKISL